MCSFGFATPSSGQFYQSHGRGEEQTAGLVDRAEHSSRQARTCDLPPRTAHRIGLHRISQRFNRREGWLGQKARSNSDV